ncbi:hypothetical protein JCM6882_004520 [Rhodosporidiobolus microsporus]
MTTSTSKRTRSRRKTATKPSSPSSRSVGFFRRLEAYMRAHPTLDDHIQEGKSLLLKWDKATKSFCGLDGVVCATPIVLGLWMEACTEGTVVFKGKVIAGYGYVDVVVVFLSQVAAFLITLPLRAVVAAIAGVLTVLFFLEPIVLVGFVLVALAARYTFADLFPFLPPALIRLIDYIVLPLVFHLPVWYFSIARLTPYNARLPLIYILLAATALLNLAPFTAAVRALAIAEDALRANGGQESEGRNTEGEKEVAALRGEVKKLLKEVKRLKGSKADA